jgi:uncharacterized membrane protein YhhN
MTIYQHIKTHLQYYYHTNLIYLPLRLALATIIGINGLAVIFGVIALKWLWDHPGSIPLVPLLFFTGISWAMAICATKLWSFKKWAFWGLCVSSVAHCIFLIVTKSQLQTALTTLIVPVIVFLFLQIGGKRKGWLLLR